MTRLRVPVTIGEVDADARGRAGHQRRLTVARSRLSHGGFVHCFGSAKAMISSLVTCDPVRPPPVLTTVTNCRPSAPR